MAVPSYDRFVEPLLRLIAASSEGIEISRARDALAAKLALTAEDLSLRLPSGQQSMFANRVGWAHDRLKRRGYSASPRRGLWRITDAGRAFVLAHPNPLSDAELEQLAAVDPDVRLRATTAKSDETPLPANSPLVTNQSPDELIEKALAELRQSVARDLLEMIAQKSPTFFEDLVLDLLRAMGYGTSRDERNRVGGSSDGGIDGIISLDRLGLEKVYVQAKRWRNDVPPSGIRDFMGALQLQGANKGVFITTSRFTREARESADRARGTMVLVDGERLASLMIDHEVGVSHKKLAVPKVDGDYFDDA